MKASWGLRIYFESAGDVAGRVSVLDILAQSEGGKADAALLFRGLNAAFQGKVFFVCLDVSYEFFHQMTRHRSCHSLLGIITLAIKIIY